MSDPNSEGVFAAARRSSHFFLFCSRFIKREERRLNILVASMAQCDIYRVCPAHDWLIEKSAMCSSYQINWYLLDFEYGAATYSDRYDSIGLNCIPPKMYEQNREKIIWISSFTIDDKTTGHSSDKEAENVTEKHVVFGINRTNKTSRQKWYILYLKVRKQICAFWHIVSVNIGIWPDIYDESICAAQFIWANINIE